MKKIILILSFLLTLTFTGCKIPTPDERKRMEEESRKIDEANIRNELHTVDYDGHSYIIYESYKRGGIIHNPDCPCHQIGGES